ncbi:hypothetical protein EGW08_001881 [Elysia chlorotica]|uniref:Uncharacterized protein n=1 Tax=Elysia chlorotica TaxID=188477 RepID=A0A433U9D6_ELYCH|nr:hypothetical protein EGW08_001881 [Elysia chlorotica]
MVEVRIPPDASEEEAESSKDIRDDVTSDSPEPLPVLAREYLSLFGNLLPSVAVARLSVLCASGVAADGDFPFARPTVTSMTSCGLDPDWSRSDWTSGTLLRRLVLDSLNLDRDSVPVPGSKMGRDIFLPCWGMCPTEDAPVPLLREFFRRSEDTELDGWLVLLDRSYSLGILSPGVDSPAPLRLRSE